MAIAMVASSFAGTLVHLMVARVIVGIGIGTVLACIAAFAADFAPPGRQNFAVGILQGGYPLGATFTGFVTAWALPHFGWQGVLLGTGLVTIAILPLAWFILPEAQHLSASSAKVSLGDAIGGSRLRSSLLLWCATIGSFMALYFIASWITKLAIEAGLLEKNAIIASAIYNIGAFFGVLGMSLAANRMDIRKLAAILLIAAAAAFLWFGGVRMSVVPVLCSAFVLGVTLQGGFNALYPLAARVYPARVRATGIGWAMGIGRIGAFTGPFVGGWALSAQLPLIAVFGIFCVPLLIAAASARAVTFEEFEQ
jgi:predicted MFS family arabinose efflux permease